MANADKQRIRLAWLKKNRPNDPEIKKLQKAVGGGQTGGGVTVDDGKSNFDSSNLGSIDAFLDGIFDNFKMPDYSGAPQILTDNDYEKARLEEEDLIYKKETEYDAVNRLRDLEETKQELANRGIAYDPAAANDPNTMNLYGKTVGQVEKNYKLADQAARDKARNASTDSVTKKALVNKTAYDSFIDTATKSFTSQLDAMNSGGALLNSLMTKYNVDQSTAQANLDRKSKEKLMKMEINARNRGGGSPQGGNSNSGGGFEIIG